MPRRAALVLLVLGLAVFASWLLVGRGGEREPATAVPREEGDASAQGTRTLPAGEAPPSLAGSPEVDPESPEGVTARVLGPGGVVLPDWPVVVIGPEGDVPHVRFTGADGEARFPMLPLDGSHAVATLAFGEKGGLHPAERVAVRRPEVVLRTTLGVPCEVVAVDVETGRSVPDVAWSLYPWAAFVEGGSRPLRTGRRMIAVEAGRDLKLALRLAVPAGYVLWANDAPYVRISRYAKALRYVVPLHREAEVELDVLEHDGSPARDPYVSTWSVSGKEGASAGHAETERLAVNRLRIREVPYVEGARLEVRVGLETVADHRLAVATTPLERRTRLVVRLPHPDEYTLSDVPFKGPAPGMIGLGGGGDSPPPVPPEGRVRVTAFLRDESPAAGATIYLRYLETGYALRAFRAVLDEGGRYEGDIPEGTWRVHFYEPGLVQTGTTFEVRAGETTKAPLQEGEGGTVQVRVVGPDGRPLPFARVGIDDRMWRDLQDGVQRLDPHVDEHGARTLRHVSPGDFEVSAWYAGGTDTSEVTVIEGETVSVTVTVDPAE